MLQHNSIERAQQRRAGIANIGIRFLAATFFLSWVAVSTALSQCNTSPTTYSDIWLWSTGGTYANGEIVYDEANPPTTFVAGAGYIQDPYNSCGHEYYVDYTNVLSPGGRMAEGGGGVNLVFDLDEPGDYSTESTYSQFCPIIYQSYGAGSSFQLQPIGVSFSTYRKAIEYSPTRALYTVIPNCNVTCKANTATYSVRTPPLPTFLRSAEPYLIGGGVVRICSRISAIFGTEQEFGCVDVEI